MEKIEKTGQKAGKTSSGQLMDPLEAAKKNFLETAKKLDPFAPVRRKPCLSVGCAFLSGLVAGGIRAGKLPVVPLLLDGASLALRYLLDKKR